MAPGSCEGLPNRSLCLNRVMSQEYGVGNRRARRALLPRRRSTLCPSARRPPIARATSRRAKCRSGSSPGRRCNQARRLVAERRTFANAPVPEELPEFARVTDPGDFLSDYRLVRSTALQGSRRRSRYRRWRSEFLPDESEERRLHR